MAETSCNTFSCIRNIFSYSKPNFQQLDFFVCVSTSDLSFSPGNIYILHYFKSHFAGYDQTSICEKQMSALPEDSYKVLHVSRKPSTQWKAAAAQQQIVHSVAQFSEGS